MSIEEKMKALAEEIVEDIKERAKSIKSWSDLKTVSLTMKSKPEGGRRYGNIQPGDRFGVKPEEADRLVDSLGVATRNFDTPKKQFVSAEIHKRWRKRNYGKPVTKEIEELRRKVERLEAKS